MLIRRSYMEKPPTQNCLFGILSSPMPTMISPLINKPQSIKALFPCQALEYGSFHLYKRKSNPLIWSLLFYSAAYCSIKNFVSLFCFFLSAIYFPGRKFFSILIFPNLFCICKLFKEYLNRDNIVFLQRVLEKHFIHYKIGMRHEF